MELFTVKRYTGEAIEESGKNEEAVLQKLLQKAEKRKRKQKQKLEQATIAIAEDTDTNENKSNLNEKGPLGNVDPTDDEVASTHSNNEDTGFQVLGEDVSAAKRPKVEMTLPLWLAHPTVIATSLPKADDESEPGTHDDALENLAYLTAETRQALKNMQIKRLFPVQTVVIPWILEAQSKPYPYRPRDICVSAPTGSGKTLAFAVPVVQLLANRVECKIRALVVLPVAELALQVFKVFKALCNKTVLNVCLLSKQTAFALEQTKLVEEYKGVHYSKVDIVVTTPGRLVDHLHATKGFCLKSLRFLVIDEADRIMDAVFQNWLYHFDTHVRDTSDQLLSGRSAPLCLMELEQNYSLPHKLLFSATLSQDPEKLQNLRLFHPKLFTSVLMNMEELAAKLANAATDEQQNESGQFLGKYTTPAELTEKYCIVLPRVKPLTVFLLIRDNNWKKFLCFTNSAESASRLACVLKHLFEKTASKICVKELTANMTASARNKTLSELARGKINGLIASDALARGIDVPNVDVVISYDMPRHIKTYIHRVGRTARAGRAGTAVTLLTQTELEVFNKTLGEVGKALIAEINVSATAEVEHADIYAEALSNLRNMVDREKRMTRFEKKFNQRRAIVPEDLSKLTLMEKLQIEADVQGKNLRDNMTAEVKEEKPQIMKMHRTKFNTNASKHKRINL